MHWKQFTFIVCVLFFVVATSTFAQDLIVKSVSVSTASADYTANLDGPAIVFSFTIRNQGSAAAAAGYKVGIYLSTNTDISTTVDYLIASYTRTGTPLGGGDEDPYSNRSITIKRTINTNVVIPNGDYYLGIYVDYEKVATETNENNNTNYDPSRKVLVRYPDLSVPSILSVSYTGRKISFAYQIKNGTSYVCNKAYKIKFYLSNDSNISNEDNFIGVQSGPNLNGNEIKTLSNVIEAYSVPDGVYYLGIYIDADDQINESSENNNTRYFTTKIIFMDMPGIQPTVSGTASVNNYFYVYVKIGAGIQVTNLLGLSGTLEYSHPNYINYDNNFSYSGLGTSSELISITPVNEELPLEPGKIHFSATRKATVGGKDFLNQTVVTLRLRSIATTPSGTKVHLSLSNVQAFDPNGNQIQLQALDWMVTIVSGNSVQVWPGDTNNDGRCNVHDILPIGIYWNKFGPNRTCHPVSEETVWKVHTVVKFNTTSSWDPIPSSAYPWFNAAWADADGNGNVGANDVNVVNLNKGKTHDLPLFNALMKPSIQGILRPIANVSPARGQTFIVELQAEQIENMFGIACDLNYPRNLKIEPVSVEPGSWPGTDALFISTIDQNTGTVSLGITRKAGEETLQGQGIVARIIMKATPDYVPGETIDFTLSNILANDNQGQTYTLAAEDLKLTSIAESPNQNIPDCFNLYANYPNPFNPATHIAYDLPEELKVRIEVFDLLGRQVCTLVDETKQAGKFIVTWNGRDQSGKVVSSGIYMYRITAGAYSATRTMVFLP